VTRASYSLAIIVLAFSIALAATFFAATTNMNNAENLCQVLYGMIEQSGAQVGQPGSPGYEYYRENPGELAEARRQNREFLDLLPCADPTPNEESP
jgi:hypothetical protein